MMKLGLLSHLLVVLTPAAAQPAAAQFGPFHSAVDDFGQIYYATKADSTIPIQLGPFQTYFSSNSIPAISAASSTIIFVASNSGRWHFLNPATFILSSDPLNPADPSAPDANAIVSDASWFCKGYGETAGVTQADWPKVANAGALITAALTANLYKTWPKAVELGPNFNFQKGTVENIPLEANFLWAAGLEPNNSEDPPRNAICIKSLA